MFKKFKKKRNSVFFELTDKNGMVFMKFVYFQIVIDAEASFTEHLAFLLEYALWGCGWVNRAGFDTDHNASFTLKI